METTQLDDTMLRTALEDVLGDDESAMESAMDDYYYLFG